jgi:DNA-binding transcriptional LysR family regulator
MAMENWNDLKLVLAIFRARSLTGGAGLLGINHSTIFRNLNSIEEKLGARLFERLPGGTYLPTPVGEQVARAAERMETEAHALDGEITGTDTRLTGSIRVTASETLAYSVLTQQLVRFRQEQPGITVEMLIDNRIFNLSRREADVALRVTRPKEAELFGRKLSLIGWTIYAAPGMVDAGLKEPNALAHLPFVGWGEDVRGVAAAEWLADAIQPRAVVYRSNSLINQYRAAREGMGLAVLPCYLADGDPGLERVIGEPVAELTRELWIVTHEDLKGTARIRAFLDVVGGGLAEQQQLFEGRRS